MLQTVMAESRTVSPRLLLADLPEAIHALDLQSIALKLQDNNPDWTPQRATEAVHDYRYFLALLPGWGLAPL